MIVLSCGHTVGDLYERYSVSVKSEGYEHYCHSVNPAVEYMDVCKDCYDMYFNSDSLLLTREDEENYLRNGL